MKKYLLVFLLTAFAACNNAENNSTGKKDVMVADGEQLYKVNCSQCHKPAQEFVGPALKNVSARWKDQHLLYDFVRNSQDVIKRDDYAKALFAKYNQSPMLPMPYLTNEDIEAILKYCNEN